MSEVNENNNSVEDDNYSKQDVEAHNEEGKKPELIGRQIIRLKDLCIDQ